MHKRDDTCTHTQAFEKPMPLVRAMCVAFNHGGESIYYHCVCSDMSLLTLLIRGGEFKGTLLDGESIKPNYLSARSLQYWYVLTLFVHETIVTKLRNKMDCTSIWGSITFDILFVVVEHCMTRWTLCDEGSWQYVIASSCCVAVAMLVALLMPKPVGGRRQKKGQDWEMQAEREQQPWLRCGFCICQTLGTSVSREAVPKLKVGVCVWHFDTLTNLCICNVKCQCLDSDQFGLETCLEVPSWVLWA